MAPAIIIFLVGLTRIMSKVPSKHERELRDQREREEWEKQQQNESDEV
ncbi:hypothetical protein ACLI1A_11305 [Flavobacterium sp. RHBU_3]